MATIHDIAKIANTSVATVSYVLNGKGGEKRISQETQKRILTVAQRLNYRPNLSARQTRMAQSSNIRIVLLWPEYHVGLSVVSLIQAMKNYIQSNIETIEISLQFYFRDHLLEKWNQYNITNCSGIVLAGAGEGELAVIKEYSKDVPVVLVNRTIEGFPSVQIDYSLAGRIASEVTITAGNSDICCFWGDKSRYAFNAVGTAFKNRCLELGINLEEDAIFSCLPTSEATYNLAVQLIDNNLLHKALFCGSESMAEGLLYAFHEKGIQVGKDVYVLVVNYGMNSFGKFLIPPVSVIDMRIREVFEKALHLCYQLIIQRGENNTSSLTLEPGLIRRDSLPISRY